MTDIPVGRNQMIPTDDLPNVSTFRLEQPLDAEVRLALVRAAVALGFQVFVTEVTDAPLAIETLDCADLGIPEHICEHAGLRLLLIDEKEVRFIRAGASWLSTPRREEESFQDGKVVDYRVQYGRPDEIDARNQAHKRAEETARRRMLQDKRVESSNPILRSLHSKVRKLKKEKLTHQEMCLRLGSDSRPPGVVWRHLSWPAAFRHFAVVSSIPALFTRF